MVYLHGIGVRADHRRRGIVGSVLKQYCCSDGLIRISVRYFIRKPNAQRTLKVTGAARVLDTYDECIEDLGQHAV